MLGCPATDEDLIEWSKELGSDITFFLSKGTAYCTGRGEILEPLPALSPKNLIYIVKVTLNEPHEWGDVYTWKEKEEFDYVLSQGKNACIW